MYLEIYFKVIMGRRSASQILKYSQHKDDLSQIQVS